MGEGWFSREDPGAVFRGRNKCHRCSLDKCFQLEGAHESPGPGENTHSDLGGGTQDSVFLNAACPHTGHTWSSRALCHISKFTSSHPVTELLLSPSCREVLDYVNLFPHPLPPSPPPSVLNAPNVSPIYLGTTHQHIIDCSHFTAEETAHCNLYRRTHIINLILN